MKKEASRRCSMGSMPPMHPSRTGDGRCLLYILIFALFLLVPFSIVRAKWKIVYTLSTHQGFRAGFFFNEDTGFIAGLMGDGVYKTTDGGKTWTNAPIPLVPKSGTNHVTQILMADPLHGWLTCEPLYTTPPTYPGLYQTTDGGASWNPVNWNQDFSDIYRTPSVLVVTSRTGSGILSTDGGSTFQTTVDSSNGLDFVDGLHGVMTSYERHGWYRSSDGGKTWLPISTIDTESWSVYGVKSTPWFFTAGEGDDISPPLMSKVRRSSDFGATWVNTGVSLPFRSTGHIAGFGFTLYTQVEVGNRNGYQGLYRSNDSGRTWESIGGPSNDRDTRFCVLGCRGEVIYAFDETGNVWKTTDGGDGSLPQWTLPPSALNIDSIDACHPRDTTIAIKNLGCDTILITNAAVPSSPPLSIFDLRTGLPPVFPIVIPPDSSGALELELQALAAGPYQSQVALTIERDGSFSTDTLTVTSALRFSNPLHVSSAQLRYDSTALCSSRDTTLILSIDSCFGVYIVSSQLKYGANFVLDTALANDSIGPFSSKTLSVRFAPTQLGQITDSLIVNLLVLGKPVRMSVPLSGIGKSDNPQLVMADRFGVPIPSEIEFDTMTRCQDSIFAFTISEKGCDSLYVSLEWFDSTQTKSPPSSEFKWFTPASRWITQAVAPVVAGIEVTPGSALGNYQGYLRVSDSIKGSALTIVRVIPYHVFVKPGTRTLSLDDSPRNFDTLAFCDSRDTVITINNLGCDTLHVAKIGLSGPNFIFVPPLRVPFIIRPDDSLRVTLRYLPAVSGLAFDTLQIATDGDSAGVRNIPLAGYATPADTIEFKAVAEELTVKPGDTATVLIMPNGSFNNPGLNSIKITLAYNSDIMTLFDPNNASTNVRGASPPIINAPLLIGGKILYLPVTIAGSNLTFDSGATLLRLQFRIMLSDSARTDFRIADIELNNGDFNFGKCALGAISDSATIGLQFVCGDSLLYNFLRFSSKWSPEDGIVSAIGGVRPDPVLSGSSLSIPYTSLRAVTVKLEIMDSKGAVVFSDIQNTSEAGASEFLIPNLPLPSGAYQYRLQTTDGGRGMVSGSFVVVK
ncbi:MAG TPA: hypothetical protein VFH95_10900 [Candidatus Kapabacteria bacterium]|nr:hypothetical protein [Candidatus Kapabacteria bacterium]